MIPTASGRGSSYRNRKAAQPIETIEVELPSGEKFLLRKKVDLEMFVVSGVLPLSIADKMESAQKKGSSVEAAFEQLSSGEKIKSIEFSTKLVRHICISPKIVDNPQTDDEIAPEELLPEDFTFLLNWAQSGGGEAGKLDGFHPERPANVVDFADGAKLP